MGTGMSDTPTPEKLVDGLVRLLTVEKRAADIYAGSPQKGGVGRVFGGQVLAQALQAAQSSVTDGKTAHSLHAYFLRGGKEGIPIEYRIERDFDGRSFSNRRVVAAQENEDGSCTPILNLTASFQVAEDGLEHIDSPMPEVEPPEELKSDMEMRRIMAEKMGDKLSDDERKEIESAIDGVEEAMKGDDKAAIDQAVEKLTSRAGTRNQSETSRANRS